jgi:hypothetical protein
MKRKLLSNAKLIALVESKKGQNSLKTISIFDTRVNRYLDEYQIEERNIKSFIDVQDLKETLNWNLNGDASKYQFKWGQTSKYSSQGVAYIFD